MDSLFVAMRKRKDGEATRRRVLNAARDLFGRKGYRDTTHAELCRRARVNIASINYHFGSKDKLYRAAWAQAAEEVEHCYPHDGGVPASAPVEDRLRGNIRAILMRNLDERLSCFHRLLMMELVNPTGLLDDDFARRLRRARTHTLGMLRELVGPAATQRDLELCEMSLISQCRMVRFRPPGRMGKGLPQYDIKDVDRLVSHIARFTLAGIRAMRNGIATPKRNQRGHSA